MISPGFPTEMRFFTRGLRTAGARVIGLGDQHEAALPAEARENLQGYVHASSLTDEKTVLAQVAEIHRQVPIDKVECLWEPYLELAAKIREVLNLPGMTVEQTLPFRDKEVMKRVLDTAGIRTPRHHSATSVAGVVDAAEDIGYPIIVKPISGAGSEHTYRVGSREELDGVVPLLRGVPEVSVEEFVEGEDMTFDTICIDGEIKHINISTYRPRALDMKFNEWISPITVTFRDVDAPELAAGREMGEAVLKALDFQTGYTHMEWYRTPNGEAIFGEIGGRSPGAHLVDLINYASDCDTYAGWAEAVVKGTYTQPTEHKYSAAWIFKRATGDGVIQRYEGLESILAEYDRHIVVLDLNPIGSPKRDWRKVLVGDGMVIVRHPDFATTLAMAETIASRLRVVAG